MPASGTLSGYALSETFGWINMGNALFKEDASVSGYGQSELAGWIRFTPISWTTIPDYTLVGDDTTGRRLLSAYGYGYSYLPSCRAYFDSAYFTGTSATDGYYWLVPTGKTPFDAYKQYCRMSTSYVLRNEDDGSGKSLINVDGRKSAKSCKAYKNDAAYTGGAAGDGVHWINPNGSWVQAYCDQTRDGGGWTMYLKHWYGDGIHGVAAASGPISVATTHKGTPYKLADTDIRALIGATNNFDALIDQSNYNTAYSNGNYEYVIIRNYTAALGFDYLVAPSSTTTAMESRRASDNALAWSGNLGCGSTG